MLNFRSDICDICFYTNQNDRTEIKNNLTMIDQESLNPAGAGVLIYSFCFYMVQKFKYFDLDEMEVVRVKTLSMLWFSGREVREKNHHLSIFKFYMKHNL